jgi:hypothetical protein
MQAPEPARRRGFVLDGRGEPGHNLTKLTTLGGDEPTIGDISILIDYLFIGGPYDPVYNPTGIQLPDCL